MLDSVRTRSKAGRSGSIGTRHPAPGAFSIELPGLGTGHYIYDPNADCPVHSQRLEPWCDLGPEPEAREELHWHFMSLSMFGSDPETLRRLGDGMIEGRRARQIARREGGHEKAMSEREGEIETAGSRIQTKQAEAEEWRSEETRLRALGEEEEAEVKRLRVEHEGLARRHRISPGKALVAVISLAFFLFDVGIMGTAFELIPGPLAWKIVMAIGIALAPLSISIGIASWLSAAEHPIRLSGKGAGRLALVAGSIAVLGLLLIIPFRAAAASDEVIPAAAFTFLGLIQVALAIAETMLYITYFDARLGVALLSEIVAAEGRATALRAGAEGFAARARRALTEADDIERSAARGRAELRREEPARARIATEEEGTAALLEGIVASAIEEGTAAARQRELQLLEEAERTSYAPVFWAVGSVVAAVIAIVVATSISF